MQVLERNMDIINYIAMDEELNVNNIVNIVAENLVHPLPNEENRRRNERPRNQNYFEVTIPRYTDVQFVEHFRMSRGTFEELLNIVAPIINQEENRDVSVSKKLIFTIWTLAKPESFLAVSDRFGLAKSTGYQIFTNVINALTQLMPVYVRWPTAEQCHVSCNIFEARSRGFSGVIGAIDGCHIPCKQPIGNSIDYYNRKGFHSIILQGVCDHQGCFIDCFIGMPGRMHDARVFRNSPLFNAIRNKLIPYNLHIIGDSAYPLLQNLMTPFKDNGHLTRSQLLYNVKLSSIRSIIERAFGILKSKFRRLRYLDISNFDLGNKMIASACVLHNFILKRDGLMYELEDDFIDNNDIDIEDDEINNINEDFTASEKRILLNNFK